MVSATEFASKVRGKGQLQRQDGQWPVSGQRQDTTSFIPLACHICIRMETQGVRSGQKLKSCPHLCLIYVNKIAPNCVFILDIGLRFEFVNTYRTQWLAPCKNLFVSYVCGFYQQLLLSVIARGNCHQSLLASLS